MTLFEFWPDHGPGPLWDASGNPVALEELDLPQALAERLRSWNGMYREGRIPVDGPGDPAWLREGVELLRQTREAVGPDVQTVVTEPGGEQNHRDGRKPQWP